MILLTNPRVSFVFHIFPYLFSPNFQLYLFKIFPEFLQNTMAHIIHSQVDSFLRSLGSDCVSHSDRNTVILKFLHSYNFISTLPFFLFVIIENCSTSKITNSRNWESLILSIHPVHRYLYFILYPLDACFAHNTVYSAEIQYPCFKKILTIALFALLSFFCIHSTTLTMDENNYSFFLWM